MPSQTDEVPDIGAGLPAWAASVAIRLEFFYERDHPERLAALMRAVESLHALAADPNKRELAFARFMRACLDLIGDAAHSRAELAGIREDLDALCVVARTALATDRDDRPLLAKTQELMGLPSPAGCAAAVPGRVVFLAAMAEHMPDEVGAATVMLVNDLAAVGPDLPLRAFEAAAQP